MVELQLISLDISPSQLFCLITDMIEDIKLLKSDFWVNEMLNFLEANNQQFMSTVLECILK